MTDLVKGTYGWQASFDWKGPAGIDALTFKTTTQVSQSIYPRLNPGGSNVTYRASSRGVTAFSPNLSLPESQCGRFEQVSMRSPNLVYKGLSTGSVRAYETTNNKPAHLVLRLKQPAKPIRELRAAIQYGVRSPTPAGSEFSLEVSTDQGQSWRRFAQSEIADDNEFSSGWLAGKTDVNPTSGDPILVRINLYAGGYTTGLLQAHLYGVYESDPPQSVELVYAWKENGELKTWSTVVSNTTDNQTFQFATDEQIMDNFVRITVPLR